jgi:hypothetical protein
MFADIREIFALIAHLVSTCVRVALPGGVRTVIAESLLLKHRLLILNRSRWRVPRLTPWDRLLFGIGAFLISPQLTRSRLYRSCPAPTRLQHEAAPLPDYVVHTGVPITLRLHFQYFL